MGINLTNALELSYNAEMQRLYSIVLMGNSLVVQNQVTRPVSSTSLISDKFVCSWSPMAIYFPTLYAV